TRFWNRSSSRLKSYHQRGYFWRNTIISNVGKKRSPLPPAAKTAPCSPPQPPDQSFPPIAANTITIGIATMILNAVVSRFRSRSGYSTENCTGYWSPPVVYAPDSIARDLPCLDSRRHYSAFASPRNLPSSTRSFSA